MVVTSDFIVRQLIKMMRQVDRVAPTLKPNIFRPKATQIELEGSHYGTLVVAYQEKRLERHLDGLALQASHAIMQESSPAEVLTKFIQKTESHVFAYMNTAPAQELDVNDYGVPPSGRPDA